MYSSLHRKSFLVVLTLLIVLAFSGLAYADEATPTPDSAGVIETPAAEVTPTEATPVPSEATPTEAAPVPTEVTPTETPVDATPTATPTEVAATDEPEGTPEVTPAENPEETPEATPEAPAATPTEMPTEEYVGVITEPSAPAVSSPSGAMTRGPQTFCQMDIQDGGDNNPFTYTFTAINTAGISSYSWNLGDSTTATTQTVSHTYTSTGSFNITLTCVPTSGPNLVLNGNITITSVPTASFMVTPDVTGTAPFSVSTVNTSTGGGLTYLWQVAGPEVHPDSNAQSVSYTFNTYGTYTITLTVTDGAGISAVASQTITVGAPPPSADMNVTPLMGTAPMTVTIDSIDHASGPIDTWTWDFDGDSVIDATGPGTFSYTYNTVGTYTIMMTYSGPGGSGTVSKQVGVFPDGDPVTADFTWATNGMETCFTNISSGPIAHNIWNFGDGTGNIEDNAAVVCHTYVTEGMKTVYLFVSNAAGDATADATQTVSVAAAPVAAFTASSTTVNQGQTVNFDGSLSTGIIDTYSWDFNGDGVEDSNVESPQNVLLSSLGANPIRLTVTGPGGSSYAEMIITVARVEITCNFTGSLAVMPSDPAQTYTAQIGNINGRTVSYSWTVTGNGANLSYSTNAFTLDWGTYGNGSYLVTLNASTPDGSSCSESKTVNVSWPALTCNMTTNLPGTVYADGATYNFAANVVGLNGRPVLGYEWYVNGVAQGVNSANFSWTNTTDTSLLPLSMDIRYTVIVDNLDSTTAGCEDTRSFTVQQWPTLACTSISGQGSPLPVTPDNLTRSYNYTANVSGVAGRTVTYTWSVTGGTITSTNPRTNNNQATVRWDGAAASFPTTFNDNISVVVTVTNPDSTTVSCNISRNIAVTINRLTCNLPVGDITPVVGETNNYSTNVTNVYGRPWAAINPLLWELEIYDTGTSSWLPVTTGTTDPFSYLFLLPNTQYRLRYSAAVDAAGGLPGDACTSNWQPLTVTNVGENFYCDSTALSGNAAPTNPGSYTYTIDMDNGNNIELVYRWVVIDSGGGEHQLAVVNSTAGGIITSPAFSGMALGPLGVDNYTLRVEVSAADPLVSTYECSRQIALVVGTITVSYSYTGNASAIEVGQSICLTNTSYTSHGDINSLNYSWDFGTAANSLGTQTSNAQQPGCLSFPNPGVYTIMLTGTNAAGTRSANYSVTFYVYGSQSIAINRSNVVYAPNTVNFQAIGQNITSNYSWEFRRVSDNSLLGTRTGANVNFFFNTPGQYRAMVSGSGPLGVTTAQLEFELIGVNDIRASFIPSVYGGVAPLHVCFTDTSSGNNITSWLWDFGNGQTLSYGAGGAPAQICTDYTVAASSFPVRLTIQNSGGLVAQATNVIRTYNTLESSSTFQINPQGGATYCFTGVLAPGAGIIGWDFGDGTTGGTSSPVCHTFQSGGTYLVTMTISDGSNTGVIQRPVVVDFTSGPAPDLSVSGSCSADRTASFAVTNTGGAMTIPDEVVIRDLNGNIVMTDSVLLGAGESRTYSVANLSGNVTFSTTDSGLSASTTCEYPPAISVVGQCTTGGVIFIISNSDGPMASAQSYDVLDSTGGVVVSGSFQLARGATPVTVTVPGSYNNQTYTFVSNGSAGNFSVDYACEPPALSAVAVCSAAREASFTLTNNGGPMLVSDTVTIRDYTGAVLQTDTVQLSAGGSITYTVGYQPSTVTFETSGSALNVSTNCEENPAITVSGICTNSGVTFIIENVGGPMLTAQSYSVTNQVGAVIDSGSFQMARGDAPVRLDYANTFDGTVYTFNSTGTVGNFTVDHTCIPAAPATTPVPGENDGERVAMAGNGLRFDGLAADLLNLPPWAEVNTCGMNCPVWQVYHTNETGNWEIFRLDGADPTTEETYRINLSHGEGEGVDDMSPSRSPNSAWIVFTSNRDTVEGEPENWELYVAPSNGDASLVQRVTFNTVALDTNPVWGPHNYVVYQSTRNGNWDLYMIDMETGREYQLTDSEADETNPAWSPDGNRIVFQSDRDGDQWQLYLLNLSDLSLTKLSDGSTINVDAQFSPDGNRIAYRSYAEADGISTIMVMDIASGQTRAITDGEQDATNQAWSPSGRFIAYQAMRNGQLDVYVYDLMSDTTRQLTDSAIPDYAPTWLCGDDEVVFTSDAAGNPDIYKAEVEPMAAPSIVVEEEADRLTFEPSDDIYPQAMPPKELASREGQTLIGTFGEQTTFLLPDVNVTPIDLSFRETRENEWKRVDSCGE